MTDQELLQAIKSIVEPLETTVATNTRDISELKDALAKTNMLIELQVIPAIQKLAEGHELILERLDDKLTERTESLQDQIDVHSAAIRQINRELRQLKKAQ